jgi:hypothetical protein
MKKIKFLAIGLSLLSAIVFINATKTPIKKLGEVYTHTATLDSNSADTVTFTINSSVFGGAEKALLLQTIISGSPDSSSIITDFYRSEESSIAKAESYFSDTLKAESDKVTINTKSDYASSVLFAIIRNTKSEVNDTAVSQSYSLKVKVLDEQ